MKTCEFFLRSASWRESLQSCTIAKFNRREEAEKQGESRSTPSGLCLLLDWIKYNMKLHPEGEACKFIQRRLSLLLLVENSHSWGFTVQKMWWNSPNHSGFFAVMFSGVLWRSFLTNGQTLAVYLAVLILFVDLLGRMEEFQKVIANCYISVSYS